MCASHARPRRPSSSTEFKIGCFSNPFSHSLTAVPKLGGGLMCKTSFEVHRGAASFCQSSEIQTFSSADSHVFAKIVGQISHKRPSGSTNMEQFVSGNSGVS